MEYVKDEDIRVSFALAPGDKLFYCPYNRSHQVLEFKAGKHLETCRKAYMKAGRSSHKIVQCRWKPSKHHLPLSQMPEHEKVCEGKTQDFLEQFDAAKVTRPAGCTTTTCGNGPGGNSNDDDYWDED